MRKEYYTIPNNRKHVQVSKANDIKLTVDIAYLKFHLTLFNMSLLSIKQVKMDAISGLSEPQSRPQNQTRHT